MHFPRGASGRSGRINLPFNRGINGFGGDSITTIPIGKRQIFRSGEVGVVFYFLNGRFSAKVGKSLSVFGALDIKGETGRPDGESEGKNRNRNTDGKNEKNSK